MVKRLFGHALLLAGLLFPRPASALELPQIAEATKPSVVLVTLYDANGTKAGSGSGFFVSADGELVTNHHVIEGAARASVSMSDGRELLVLGVLVDDPEHDIALVKVAGAGFPPLPIGDTTALHAGEDIVVIGSPLGLSTTISTGIVSAVRGDGLTSQEGFKKDTDKTTAAWGLQISAPIAPGSSGSPILSRSGDVVGVAVGLLTRGQNLNFGIPTVFVKAAMAKAAAGAPLRALDAVPDRRKNLAISIAVGLALALAFRFVPDLVRWRAGKRAGTRPHRVPSSRG